MLACMGMGLSRVHRTHLPGSGRGHNPKSGLGLLVDYRVIVNVWGKLFHLQLELFLLTVKLLCLQSLKALVRRAFPL